MSRTMTHAGWRRLLSGADQSRRDGRIDALRGIALLMIFVDHVPRDAANVFTLHNFGFCDAAEVFVLLAGFSSMAVYGRALNTDLWRGLRRIASRDLRIYLTHVTLLITMLGLAGLWLAVDPKVTAIAAPLEALGDRGVLRAFALQAMPEYLDILPLYILLLAVFPLIWLAMRQSVWWALAGSASVWWLASSWHGLNLPNMTDPNGWYFNPFAWQFLFCIGAAMAAGMRRRGGTLPQSPLLIAICVSYLIFAFAQTLPWTEWGPTRLRPLVLAPPDKSHLSAWRIIDILAIIYLIMGSAALRRAADHPVAQAFALCGRHSLEVFAVGCVLALAGRLAFESFGDSIGLQMVVNLVGISGMAGAALWRERQRAAVGRVVEAFDAAPALGAD